MGQPSVYVSGGMSGDDFNATQASLDYHEGSRVLIVMSTPQSSVWHEGHALHYLLQLPSAPNEQMAHCVSASLDTVGEWPLMDIYIGGALIRASVFQSESRWLATSKVPGQGTRLQIFAVDIAPEDACHFHRTLAVELS